MHHAAAAVLAAARGAAAPERLVHSSVETGVALCCCVGRQHSVLTVMNNLRGRRFSWQCCGDGTSYTRCYLAMGACRRALMWGAAYWISATMPVMRRLAQAERSRALIPQLAEQRWRAVW
jgi:hypothetical protein